MSTNPSEYYQILGVGSNATLEEIKRAFRQKAKELHPDKNKSDDAHERFILLTEAYEYLTDIKTGKSRVKQRASTSYTDWQRESREQARQRAREHAKMRYEEYKKTDYYKNTQAAITVLGHLYFFSAVLIMAAPLWGYLLHGKTGFWMGALFTFLSVHYWAGIFKEKIKLNFRSFSQSLVMLVKTKTFQVAGIILINLLLLFRFTLNTQLSFLEITFVLLVFYALAYLAFRFKFPATKRLTKIGLFLCLTPSLFNLTFFANFIFSSNPTTESYSFVTEMRWYDKGNSRGQWEKIAYINLENGNYDDYKWFRMFFDFTTMSNKKEITYTFEDGLFGLRVLKEYEFTK